MADTTEEKLLLASEDTANKESSTTVGSPIPGQLKASYSAKHWHFKWRVEVEYRESRSHAISKAKERSMWNMIPVFILMCFTLAVIIMDDQPEFATQYLICSISIYAVW